MRWPLQPRTHARHAARAEADHPTRRVPVSCLLPAADRFRETGVEIRAGDRILIVADRGGVGVVLRRRLERLGAEVLWMDDAPSAARLPSLRGIMQSKKKPIETRSLADLGLDGAALDAPRVRWTSFGPPPPRGEGKIVDGDAESAARELVRLLHEEAKVL